MKPKIATKHEIKNHKHVFIVLKGIAQVTDERGIDLFEKTSFLDDVGYGAHLDAFGFVDVFESIEIFGLLVLDDADFAKGAFADSAEKVEVVEIDGTVKVYHFWFAAEGAHCGEESGRGWGAVRA